MPEKNAPEKKEPFVPAEDRPEVKLDPEKPITELKVRDLSVLVHQVLVAKSLKSEIDKHKFEKLEKFEKHEKFEKFEKLEKFEKHEKFEKFEKFEKLEFEKLHKDKPEKLEIEVAKAVPDVIPDPTKIADPRIDQLIQLVSALRQQLDQLAKDVAQLKTKAGG